MRHVPLRTLLALFILVSRAKAGETVVYFNDFQSRPGSAFPEWTSSRIRHEGRLGATGRGVLDAPKVSNVDAPNGSRRFLGEFGGPRLDPTARTRVRQSIRLSLDKLPAHKAATVSFDLLVLKSWDGNSPRYGPDRLRLSVVGGPTLLNTTFSNNPKVAAEGSSQDYPRPNSPPRAGAEQVGKLGYEFFGDSAYRCSFTFPHEGKSLALEYESDLFEGKGTDDESWGLDNVKVVVRPALASGSP